MNKTLDYYENNAEEYAASSEKADLSYAIKQFSFYLHKGDCVLDLGCGSGRDTAKLLQQGFQVEAVDGSEKMAALASRYTGIEVKQKTFDEIDEVERYDGIYACASLLHVPFEQLDEILGRLYRALKKEGILYASFRYGTYEGYRGERYYTDLNEERLLQVLGPHLQKMTVLEIWRSHDVLNRDILWFNFILRRLSV